MIRTRMAALGQSGCRLPSRQTRNAFARRSCSNRKRTDERDSTQSKHALERFRAKWKPVRVKKTRQIKNLEPRFDSIETAKGLAKKQSWRTTDGPPRSTADR